MHLLANDRITAIIALSNQVAIGALKAMKEVECSLGRDLELASFDRHPVMDYLPHSIAVAEQQVTKIAELAAQLF